VKFRLRPRQPVAGLFLFAAMGIVAAEYCPASPLMPLVLLSILAALLVLRPTSAGTLLFTTGVFFMLHDFRIMDDPGGKLATSFTQKPLPVRATGIVVSEPQKRQASGNFPSTRFRLRLESLENSGSPPGTENAVVMATWFGTPPDYGDRVSITGMASNIASPRNPGQFDYKAYLKRLGIDSEISMRYPNDGEVLGGDHGNPMIAAAISTRQWMQEKLRLGLEDSPEAAGLIQGMTLGRKEEASIDTLALFQRTGTLHLFVVNGLHIGMFTAIAFLIVRLFGAGRRLSVALVVPLIWGYMLLTGLNPGSIRATIMATVLLSGQLVDRKSLMLNNLSAAGLVLLLCNTNELFMPGFKFSMGVVFAIIVLAGRLQAFFLKFGTPDPFLPRSLWSTFQTAAYSCWHHVSQLLGVSTAACLGSLPFTMEYFHLLSPSAVVANLIIVPAAFVVLLLGLLAIVSATLSSTLAATFNSMNWAVAKFILCAVHLIARIPGGHFYVEAPGLRTPPACEINILDLDAGAAIHVRASGSDWLIDCGNPFNYGSILQPYLRSRGVNRLTGFISTHAGASYTGAATLLKNDFALKQNFGLERGANAAARNDLVAVSDQVKIRVLYPPPGLNARASADKALVLQLEYLGIRVLLMPGSGLSAEQWLAGNERDLHSAILVTSPRGTKRTGARDFIEAVRPRVIIRTSPKFPPAAHNGEPSADDGARNGIQLFSQDQTGALHIELNRDGFSIRPFIGNQIFRSNSR
jgi:ComEC/Rec2-related protein